MLDNEKNILLLGWTLGLAVDTYDRVPFASLDTKADTGGTYAFPTFALV